MKTNTFSLSVIALALLFSACSNAGNTTTNTTTTNTTTKSNTAVVTNSSPSAASNTAVSNTAPASANTAQTPAGESDASQIQGELQVGKTESVILYVGLESGDYAGYCFTNESEAGRAILAACKDREQCAVTGTIDHEGACKVPGLEATLSDSGKISKVASVKSLGRKK